ncbi:MAG: hypothetical protein Tsb0020_13010 [Haliangiales bacterium]
MSILICTALARESSCVALVRAAIEARGGHVVIVDTGQFPSDLALALSQPLSAPGDSPAAVRDRGDHLGAVPFEDIESIWLRHIHTGATLPPSMRPDLRAAAALESAAALHSIFACLDVPMIDPPALASRVPVKPGQLVLARRAGLDTPRSLLSNDPAAVRAFARGLPNGLVCKMVSSLVSVGPADHSDAGASEGPIPTTVVSERELARLDGLRHSPMLFQELLPKQRELRVTAVGQALFAAALDSTGSARGAIDWRLDPALTHAWRRCDLPSSVASAIHALLDPLGLQFAAIDLIHTRDDRYVFLELNPVAYFGYIERAAGLDISGALAELLLGRAARR